MNILARSILASLALLLVGQTASADMMAPFPIPERVARAKLVVVGKVTRLEKNTLEITPYWGGTKKREFLVGVVEIKDQIKGEQKLTHVRVAFLPQRPGGLRQYPLNTQLKPGEEVCLFLSAHPSEPVYFFPYYFDRIDKRNLKQFDKDVKLAKECAKLAKDPIQSLSSKSERERMLALTMVLTGYRTPPRITKPGMTVKQEPIDAKLSEKILTTLGSANWTKPIPELQPTHAPLNLFYRLGVTKADGWTPPKDYRKRNEAARTWVLKNAKTYRIKKFVVK